MFQPQDLPLQSIFVLILIISANFLAQLFPCRVQEMLKTNMYLKHFFGLLTMMFFAVLALPNMSQNILVMTSKTLLLYIWFILITKADMYFFIAIMLCLFILYIVNILKNNISSQSKDITNTLQSNTLLLTYETYENFLFIFTFILTILGMLLYMGEKKLEYSNKFHYTIFFLGKPLCKNNSHSVDYYKTLEYIFK